MAEPRKVEGSSTRRLSGGVFPAPGAVPAEVGPWVGRMRTIMLLLFAAVPLVSHTSVQEHVYVRVPYLLALATIIWVAAASRSIFVAWVPPRPPMVGTFALWIALAACSGLWAKSPELVSVAVFRDFVIMAAAGAFAMLAAPRRGLALGLFAGTAAFALTGALVWHFTTGGRFLWPPFYQPSLAGGFAAVTFAGCFSALVARKPSGQRQVLTSLALFAVAAIAALTLWRTQALTATGSAVAGATTGFLVSRGTWGRRLSMIVPLGALAMGMGLIYYFGTEVHHPSAHIRLLLWDGALDMLRSNPLGGVGYGGFGSGYPEFRPDDYWSAIYATNWTPRAHSLYLELGACLGVPGLLLCMIFVPLALLGGCRLAREAENWDESLASAGVVGAFAAVAIVGIADLPTDYPLGRFLFFALGGLAYMRTAKEEVEGGGVIDLYLRRGMLVGVAILLVAQCAIVEPGLVQSRVAYQRAERTQAEVLRQATRLDEMARTPGGAGDAIPLQARQFELMRSSLADYLAAAAYPLFETEWTLRARLRAAAMTAQLAHTQQDGKVRTGLLRDAQRLCAETERLAPDFEDNQRLYALIEFEMGNQENFEFHMGQYLERRLGWDLRPDIPGKQNGPEFPAWEFILANVPPEAKFYKWAHGKIEERALLEAERSEPWRAEIQARAVSDRFKK